MAWHRACKDRRLVKHAIRVLVAADDAVTRRLIAGALQRAGFIVERAATGYQALERLARSIAGPELPLDLVITDLQRPGYDGLDLIGAVRALPLGPPVVLITAFGDEAVHAAARRIGAAATLDKPFDVDGLVTVAEALTAGAMDDF